MLSRVTIVTFFVVTLDWFQKSQFAIDNSKPGFAATYCTRDFRCLFTYLGVFKINCHIFRRHFGLVIQKSQFAMDNSKLGFAATYYTRDFRCLFTYLSVFKINCHICRRHFGLVSKVTAAFADNIRHFICVTLAVYMYL